jgi:hypothetical protein
VARREYDDDDVDEENAVIPPRAIPLLLYIVRMAEGRSYERGRLDGSSSIVDADLFLTQEDTRVILWFGGSPTSQQQVNCGRVYRY